MGGTWDATNVVDPAVAVVMPVGLDHQDYLGLDDRADRGREGRDHQGRAASPCSPSRSEAAAEVLLQRVAEVGRAGRPRGRRSSRSLRRDDRRRRSADDAPGPRRDLRGRLPARCTASTRPTTPRGPGRGRGLLRRRRGPARPGQRPTGLRAVTSSPAGSSSSARSPDRASLDAAHNPAGRAPSRPRSRSRSRSTSSSRVVAVLEDKDAEGIISALAGAAFEFVFTQSVVAPGHGSSTPWAPLAVGILGQDRGSSSCADALERRSTGRSPRADELDPAAAGSW